MRKLVLVAHDLRSCHNVGSLLRTADGLGVSKVYLTGYTPYPHSAYDQRLPHLAGKIHRRIQKTALGAELSVDWEHAEDIDKVIKKLRRGGYFIAALEQDNRSKVIASWRPPTEVVLILGSEKEGLERDVLDSCDGVFEIPMMGAKESFNVVQAAAMAAYAIINAPVS